MYLYNYTEILNGKVTSWNIEHSIVPELWEHQIYNFNLVIWKWLIGWNRV